MSSLIKLILAVSSTTAIFLKEYIIVSWEAYCCSSVTQSCPTLCDPMDCSTPAFSVFVIPQSLLKLTFVPSDILEQSGGFQHTSFILDKFSLERPKPSCHLSLPPLCLSLSLFLYPNQDEAGVSSAAFVPPTLCSKSHAIAVVGK